MLHPHMPTSLVGESALFIVSGFTIMYRLLGGKSEWLRHHGVILSCYYAFGGLVYDELEGWDLLDTTYFLTVTVTTVGYGDMYPETDEGKLFTVCYALLGIVFVFSALEPLLDILIYLKDLIIRPCTPKDPIELEDDGILEIEDLRVGGNWSFKYLSALAVPIFIFVLGLLIAYFVRLAAVAPPPTSTHPHTMARGSSSTCWLTDHVGWNLLRARVHRSWD